jgi:hypothetical protein
MWRDEKKIRGGEGNFPLDDGSVYNGTFTNGIPDGVGNNSVGGLIISIGCRVVFVYRFCV